MCKENEILSLKKIKEGLANKKLYKVSEETGISFPTLKKLADGKGESYTYTTLKSVSKYILETSII